MGEETRGLGVTRSNFKSVLDDALPDLGAAGSEEVAQAFEMAKLAFKLLEQPKLVTGSKGDWFHAVAGYHVPLVEGERQQVYHSVIQGIRSGRTVAILGMMAVVGRNFLQAAGYDPDTSNWDLCLLKGEWLRETLVTTREEKVLGEMARNCQLAEADSVAAGTPFVFVDATYRFERKK